MTTALQKSHDPHSEEMRFKPRSLQSSVSKQPLTHTNCHQGKAVIKLTTLLDPLPASEISIFFLIYQCKLKVQK